MDFKLSKKLTLVEVKQRIVHTSERIALTEDVELMEFELAELRAEEVKLAERDATLDVDSKRKSLQDKVGSLARTSYSITTSESTNEKCART